MKTISFFIDDSGSFNVNEDWFVYAGYSFVENEEKEIAKRKYRKLVNEIKNELGEKGELKGSNLKIKHKRSLYNVMNAYESFFVAIELKKISKEIMGNKHSRHRYKDYIIKRIIKDKIKYYIRNKIINDKENIALKVFIDEQLTASNGYYSLKETIREELVSGISNFNYDKKFEPILFGKVSIEVVFCNSEKNYLVQASDIIANRIRSSLYTSKPKLRSRSKSTNLYLP